MGKRNKTDVSGDTQTKKKKTSVRDKKEDNVSDDSTILKIKKNKNKHKTDLEKTESTNKDSELILQPDLKKAKKFKIKEKDQVNLKDGPSKQGASEEKSFNNTNPDEEQIVNEDSKLDDLVPQLEKTRKPKKVKNKHVGEKTKDEEKETINTVKQKKFLNDDEAEVKDEDIDKFCDELDEKDNKQYEDWIKLIEAKLHENKKLK